jgi:hypothetical protein
VPNRCGPSGSYGGTEFGDDYLPPRSKVIEVRVRAATVIDSIQIIHETAGGERHPMEVHGGSGGAEQVFLLDRDEYITGIRGKCGALVDSLQVLTNNAGHPSDMYGAEGGGLEYEYHAPPGYEIVGFFGRAEDKIDAIGVIMRRRQRRV